MQTRLVCYNLFLCKAGRGGGVIFIIHYYFLDFKSRFRLPKEPQDKQQKGGECSNYELNPFHNTVACSL